MSLKHSWGILLVWINLADLTWTYTSVCGQLAGQLELASLR